MNEKDYAGGEDKTNSSSRERIPECIELSQWIKFFPCRRPDFLCLTVEKKVIAKGQVLWAKSYAGFHPNPE